MKRIPLLNYVHYLIYTLLVVALIFLTDLYFTGDTVAYLNIAKKYSQGNIREAINGYWSPLISWLMVPLWWFKVYPVYIFRIVNALAGILLIYSVDQLLHYFTSKVQKERTSDELANGNFKVSRKSSPSGAGGGPGVWITRSIIVLFCIAFQLECHSPDFLSAACLMFFLSRQIIAAKKRVSMLSLLSIFMLVFSKGIFLYLTPAFIVVLGILDWFGSEKKKTKIADSSVVKLFFTGILIVSWGFVLQYKYGYFSLGSAGKYNEYLVSIGNQKLHYHSFSGLIAPKEPSMVYPMEDPTLFPIDYLASSKGLDIATMQKRVAENFPMLLYLLRWFSFMGIVLPVFLLTPLFLLISRAHKIAYAKIYLVSLLVLLIYLPVFYEERYTLPSYIGWILCGFTVVYFISKTNFQLLTYCLYGFLVISFGKNFYVQYTVWQLRLEYNKHTFAVIESLQQKLELKNKRVAVNNDAKGFDLPSMLMLLSDGKHYGELSTYSSSKKDIEELNEHAIDYLFVTGCPKISPDHTCSDIELSNFLKAKPVVFQDAYFGLKVYQLRQE